MLGEIKEELLKNPEAIVELMEHFGFEHIKLSSREIRLARNDRGGQNISIRLHNNEHVYVNDFVKGISTDIFSYIIQEKNTTFKDVIRQTKSILGLSDDWMPQQKKALFGGIYSNISCGNRDVPLKTYDESILDKYERVGNVRWLRDNISLASQKFWNIRFSAADNSIIIPMYNEYSNLVGIKARINREPRDDESKYYYPVGFPCSQILYGWSANYSYLYGNTAICVESEKSVCQAWDMNVRNIVALGSNSLSEKQAKLLIQLQPTRIIIALDKGLEFEQTQRNADMIKSVCGMFMPEIWYWNADLDASVKPKSSPTDMGKEKFEEIMREQLVQLY